VLVASTAPGFDHDVGVGDPVEIGGTGDAGEPCVGFVRGEAAARRCAVVMLGHRVEAARERFAIGLDDGHGHAGIGEAHGDAAAHGAGADHRCPRDVARLRIGEFGELGRLALGKEDVALGLRLLAGDEVQEQRALAFERLLDGQRDRPAQRFDRGGRRIAASRPPEVADRGGVEFLDVAAPWREPVVAVLRQHRHPPLRHDAARERHRRRGEIALDDGVDQAGLERLCDRHRIAREYHRHRLVEADEARQPLGAAGARDQAELDLGQPQPRARRRHPEMAAERDFEAAAERRAVQGGDHRLGARLDRFDHVDGGGLSCRLAEFADVGAGNEGAPGADDHDRGNTGVRLCPRHQVDKTGPQREIQRIDGRIVDGDDRDVAVIA